MSADTYLYCEDNGHILNEDAMDAEGWLQCECCGRYFDPGPEESGDCYFPDDTLDWRER